MLDDVNIVQSMQIHLVDTNIMSVEGSRYGF